MKFILSTLFFFFLLSSTYSQDRSSALKVWHDNKYSMFIHFGMYSGLGGVYKGKPVTVGYSEQIQAHANIYSDVYEELASDFNPSSWNADSIVALAKQAGMRSVVITSKHHDGFCMFRTATTRFNIVDATPFKRDVIRELSEACKRGGVHFGLYFSLIDYRLHPWWNSNATPVTAAHHEYNKKQVTELLTKYGPISEMWFDMGSLTSEQSHEIYDLVHKLQPDCMVSGRLGNDAYDFCVMGDNSYPDYKIDAAWQTPASIFDETWGYRSWQKRDDVQGKRDQKLLSLLKVVSRGGNYLLNIGPMGDGTVVPYEADVLRGIGSWLNKNGEAIYGTGGNPFPESFSWGEVTTKMNKIYLILSGKPVKEISLPGISGKLSKVSLLGDVKIKLKTKVENGGLLLTIPENLFQPHQFQVVVVEYANRYQLSPEQLLTGNALTLDFHNAIKHYSYSCIDYYNNHRSVVKESWNFIKTQNKAVPVIYYTAQELGKALELKWNGQAEEVKLTGGEQLNLNEKSVPINWGNRYYFTPYRSDFEGSPGAITQSIDPVSGWGRNPERKWNLIPDWKNGVVENMDSKPMESLFVLQEITVGVDQNELIEIQSGSGVIVWLNGENLVKHNNIRGTKLNKELVLLSLKAGKNQLLIKFYNRYDYQNSYCINNAISRQIYCQKLSPHDFKGLNNCELRLYKPESEHQPIRMNNVKIAF